MTIKLHSIRLRYYLPSTCCMKRIYVELDCCRCLSLFWPGVKLWLQGQAGFCGSHEHDGLPLICRHPTLHPDASIHNCLFNIELINKNMTGPLFVVELLLSVWLSPSDLVLAYSNYLLDLGPQVYKIYTGIQSEKGVPYLPLVG